MTPTDTEHIEKAAQLAHTAGNDDLADRLESRLEDRQDAVETIVEIRELAERSEAAGLTDDPAVDALREHADALAEKHGLELDPTVTERLADEYGLRETAVKRLHEDDRQRLEESLAAVEKLQESATATDHRVGQHELDARRDTIASLLDHNDVEAAELLGDDVDTDEDGDHAAALLADLDPEEV